MSKGGTVHKLPCMTKKPTTTAAAKLGGGAGSAGLVQHKDGAIASAVEMEGAGGAVDTEVTDAGV